MSGISSKRPSSTAVAISAIAMLQAVSTPLPGVASRKTRSQPFERSPQGVNLPSVPEGGLRDLPAGERHLNSETLAGEKRERGEDRAATDLKLVSELRLEQPGAGRQDALEDVRATRSSA